MRIVNGTTNLIHLHDNLKTVIWLQSWGIFQTLSKIKLNTIKQQKILYFPDMAYLLGSFVICVNLIQKAIF